MSNVSHFGEKLLINDIMHLGQCVKPRAIRLEMAKISALSAFHLFIVFVSTYPPLYIFMWPKRCMAEKGYESYETWAATCTEIPFLK